MSLVKNKTLVDYDESYLYNQLRSFHESEQDVHYVLTHFVQKTNETKDANQALSRMQRKAQGLEPKQEVSDTSIESSRVNISEPSEPNIPTTPKEPVVANDWDANDWGPNTNISKPELDREPAKPTTTHVERIPESLLKQANNRSAEDKTETVEQIKATPQTSFEPKTAIARRRPANRPQPTRSQMSAESTNNSNNEAEQIRLNRLRQQEIKAKQEREGAQARRQNANNDVRTNNQTQNNNLNNEIIKQQSQQQNDRNVNNTTNNQRVFMNLQKSFETSEWITKSNQMKVATRDALKNMIVDKINIVDLRDKTNTDTYISLSSRTMHLLYSVAIGANLDIILIFNDSTTIRLAPESWLRSANAQTLIQNQYFYIYKDLNLNDFQQSLKPLIAEEISTSDYMQMFLKYSPIVTEK